MNNISSQSAAAVTIVVDDRSPVWGKTISASGHVPSMSGGTITVDWGDGSTSPGIALAGNDWGPVSHVYSSAGTNFASASLVSSGGTTQMTSMLTAVSVQKHRTAIMLDHIPDVVRNTTISFTGQLIDNETKKGLEGQQVIFDGTGVVNTLPSVNTQGIIFDDPSGVTIEQCTASNCTPVSGSSINDLRIHIGSEISFPPGVTGVTLIFEGNNNNFVAQVTTNNGMTEYWSGSSDSFDIAASSYVEKAGISRVQFTQIDGSGVLFLTKVKIFNSLVQPSRLLEFGFDDEPLGTSSIPLEMKQGSFSYSQTAKPLTSNGLLNVVANYAGNALFSPSSDIKHYATLDGTLGVGGAESAIPDTGVDFTSKLCSIADPDSDRDGLCDSWENYDPATPNPNPNSHYGIPYTVQINPTGPPSTFNLPLSAHDERYEKDVYVQIDGLSTSATGGTQAFTAAANTGVGSLIPIFSSAPTGVPPVATCPSCVPGVNLHLNPYHLNQIVPSTGGSNPIAVWLDSDTDFKNDFDSIKSIYYGNETERPRFDSNNTAFGTIYMHDSPTTGVSTFGKTVQVEEVTSSSVLVNKQINTIVLQLKKGGSPTGTGYIGTFDSNGNILTRFGTLDPSSLTTSYKDYTFSLASGGVYTILSGDRIGIKYTGGDSSNYISVMRDTGNTFDGTNSLYQYYDGSTFQTPNTSWDLYMALSNKNTVNTASTLSPNISVSGINFWTPAGPLGNNTNGAVSGTITIQYVVTFDRAVTVSTPINQITQDGATTSTSQGTIRWGPITAAASPGTSSSTQTIVLTVPFVSNKYIPASNANIGIIGTTLQLTATGTPSIVASNGVVIGSNSPTITDTLMNAKAQAWRYALWAFCFGSSCATSPSGISETITTQGGNDMIVAVSNPSGVYNPTDSNSHAATFMHELGHNLGLMHGGPNEILTNNPPTFPDDSATNCKPNYMSVMSYPRQLATYLGATNWGIDYSHGDFTSQPLHENNLFESNGLQGGSTSKMVLFGAPLTSGGIMSPNNQRNIINSFWTSSTGGTTSPINWDADTSNIIETQGVTADINNLGMPGCDTNKIDSTVTFNDYNDWPNLFYNFTNSGSFNGVHGDPHDLAEVTPAVVTAFKNNLEQYTCDGTLRSENGTINIVNGTFSPIHGSITSENGTLQLIPESGTISIMNNTLHLSMGTLHGTHGNIVHTNGTLTIVPKMP